MDNKFGKIENREITEELRESYLDYAMSVIVSRALPDVRDGLKPVQRRILWAMWDTGLKSGTKYRKSAAVVGEVLKAYHPHGDIAVYDALARMAQDFSLRYPLIDGQGNWGCFTKDTKIKLTDGRSLSFGELVEEDKQGKTNYTYTVNSLGLISIAPIKKPRLTIKGAELIKVTLDNGKEIRCTPNHLFMLKNGSYKEARELTKNDSIMPFYQKLSEKTDRINRDGYLLIYQPKTNEWVPAHHMADNYNLTNKIYKKNAGRVRHHFDFNKIKNPAEHINKFMCSADQGVLRRQGTGSARTFISAAVHRAHKSMCSVSRPLPLNNNPENIIRMKWGEHWKLHYDHASELHKNPEYREKISAGRKKYLDNPLTKIKYAKLLSERNIKNWQNLEYREKMRNFLSEVNRQFVLNHPEKRVGLSERATKTLKRLWQNSEYRAFMNKKIIKGNKNHTSNRTGKLKFLNICKEILNRDFELNKENYEEVRKVVYPYGRATMWETGLDKYFKGNPNLIRQEINQNHRIKKTEKLLYREDVYDLTIDGSHNFCLDAGVFVHNSIDGDNQAAMRYTECRLSKISEELLFDIEKETVNWAPNYDASVQEPKVLPAKLPNLLLNGTTGIAVGMATNIPPHNLGEIIDATIYLIDQPKAVDEDLLKFVKGPDFPTGGIIYDAGAIANTYATGRGPITIRAKTEIEERAKNQFNIVVHEIPYQVNKSELIIKIAQLAQDKKIEGIRDLRDESDREGMRIVVELKSDASPQKVLNQLFQYADLQKNFNFNMIALVGGIQPRVLSLKEILEAHIGHRQEVVRRRAEFELRKTRERAHILEGLAKALSVIDKIIETIKKSKDRDEARTNLIKKFILTEIQANAILEMRLATLAALERQKIEEELAEKKKIIKELEILLKSPEKILKVIKDELSELKNKFGDARRTQVVSSGLKEFKDEDLVPFEEAVIAMTADGYIKRMPPGNFKTQKRGGKGLIGSEVGEEDSLNHFISANTHDNILFFTDKGRAFQTKVYEIPVGSRISKGKLIQNFLEIPGGENVSAVVSYGKEQIKGGFLVMLTRAGVIKKTSLEEFESVRRTGIIAINLSKEDALKWVKLSSGKDEIILATAQGQAIRFKETQLRSMGRTAAGVRGIRLKKADMVAGLDIINSQKENEEKSIGDKLLAVTENGFAKQTPLKEYRLQSRGGGGIKTAKINSKTGALIAIQIIGDEEDLLALSVKGQIIKTKISSIRAAGRATSGVKIMRLDSGDKVAGVVIF